MGAIAIIDRTQQGGVPPMSYGTGGDLSEELALVSRAQSGDSEAFSSLVNGYLKTLYKVVVKITKNHEDAEDTVQDAILKAYANLSRFQGRARFSTWITRIAINEALMRLRKYKHVKNVSLEDCAHDQDAAASPLELDSTAEDPETIYAGREIRAIMSKALGNLPPMYYRVIHFTHMKERTIRETAKELALPPSTVKARVSRARRHLRGKLGALGLMSASAYR